MIQSRMGSSINTWAAEHMQAMQKVQRDAMNDEDRRTNTIKELSDIKALLQDAKAGGPDATGKAQAAIDAFVTEHKNDPDLPDIMKSLQATKDRLDDAGAEFKQGMDIDPRNPKSPNYKPDAATSSDKTVQAQIAWADAIKADASKKATSELDGSLTSLQGVIDELGKGNQMGMLDIQEANSQQNQIFQTASNIASSRSSAAQTAVGNIRG